VTIMMARGEWTSRPEWSQTPPVGGNWWRVLGAVPGRAARCREADRGRSRTLLYEIAKAADVGLFISGNDPARWGTRSAARTETCPHRPPLRGMRRAAWSRVVDATGGRRPRRLAATTRSAHRRRSSAGGGDRRKRLRLVTDQDRVRRHTRIVRTSVVWTIKNYEELARTARGHGRDPKMNELAD